VWQPTSAGCDALNRLIDAPRAHLADLIAEWPTEQREEVVQRLRRIAEGLVPDLDRGGIPTGPERTLTRSVLRGAQELR
jgi:hypothetical protein